MKLAITTHYMMEAYGDEDGIRRLADIGFDGLDFGLFRYPLDGPLFAGSEAALEDYFGGLKAVADRAGIVVNQVHSQMPSYWTGDAGKTAFTWKALQKAILAAGCLGSPYIVIHPAIPAGCRYSQGRAEARALNLEFYGSLTPLLEQHRVRMGIENMFSFDPERQRICPTVCAEAEEMIDYIDALGPQYVACLDVGHSVLSGSGPADMARKLGPRLELMHAHENNGLDDCHMAPMIGFNRKTHSSAIDWAEFAAALKAVGYRGMFSLEPDSFFAGYGPRLAHEAAVFLYAVARQLVRDYGV